MFSTRNFNRSKPVLFILILFPSLLWAYQFVTGNLGVNPIEKLMDELGLMALRLIIITLTITTLSNIKPLKSIVVLRRMIGLFAFYYVCLHFSTYIVLDHFLDIQFIIQDIIKRPFITFGFTPSNKMESAIKYPAVRIIIITKGMIYFLFFDICIQVVANGLAKLRFNAV